MHPEEVIDDKIRALFQKLHGDTITVKRFSKWISGQRDQAWPRIDQKRTAFIHEIKQTRERINQLANLLISDLLDQDQFSERKNTLVLHETELKQNLATVETTEYDFLNDLEDSFDFAQSAAANYQYGNYHQKRQTMKKVIESMKGIQRDVVLRLRPTFETILQWISGTKN
jgi:hypothetical protein